MFLDFGIKDEHKVGGVSINVGASLISAPTAAMGAKAWWSFRDQTKTFSDDGATQISNGEGIFRNNDQLSVVANDHLRQTGSASRPIWTTNGANNQPYANFNGTGYIDSLAISNFMANNAKVVILAMSISTGSTSQVIWCDVSSPYIDARTYSGNTIKTQAWPGGSYRQTTGVSYVVGVPFVYVFKHASGFLYDAINGISWTTAVADGGNTSSMTNSFTIGTEGAGKPMMRVYDVVLGNSIADNDILAIVNYLKAQLQI